MVHRASCGCAQGRHSHRLCPEGENVGNTRGSWAVQVSSSTAPGGPQASRHAPQPGLSTSPRPAQPAPRLSDWQRSPSEPQRPG